MYLFVCFVKFLCYLINTIPGNNILFFALSFYGVVPSLLLLLLGTILEMILPATSCLYSMPKHQADKHWLYFYSPLHCNQMEISVTLIPRLEWDN
uniref:Uncharacterized protein n=1 Tax=Arundo donax TaxID=35708 RepID=A0A0A9HDJ7_ARUDO